MLLVAFCGSKGVGKSVCAAYLEKFGFVRASFATPLKSLVCNLLNLDRTMFEDGELKEQVIGSLNVSPRVLMQVIGTDLFREEISRRIPDIKFKFGNVWTHCMHEILKQGLIHNECIVIDDLRFENEARLIEAFGGIIVRVESGHRTQNTVDEHRSEQEFCKIKAHWTVENSDSSRFLKMKLLSFLQSLLNEMYGPHCQTYV